MSLYYEAVDVIEAATTNGGSIKSIVFGRKDWKSNPKALFALATEAAKWSEILSEVIEKGGLLKIEKQLTPTLALLLTHDLLLAKKGLALPTKHGLYAAVTRHKARLSAELTKLRLRRGCTSIEALKAVLDDQAGDDENGVEMSQTGKPVHPRWIRINTIRTSLDAQLSITFAEYKRVDKFRDIVSPGPNTIYIDKHIPNLIAIRPSADITATSAYKNGDLILQDKASCFPAYLLDPASFDGDVIDACAAPGNKTTHLAALISTTSQSDDSKAGATKRKIIACERDAARSQTLAKMIKLAGADDIVRIKANQDFLKLDPKAPEFANVKAILLDPSCSGSGIIGRDEGTVRIHLPKTDEVNGAMTPGSKKRKRKYPASDSISTMSNPVTDNEVEEEEEVPTTRDSEDKSQIASRLAALSSFQLRLLEHAMSFPAAQRITYSTCSLHKEENEHVVAKALLSDVARDRSWRVLRRDEQVEGLRKWPRRGNSEAVEEALEPNSNAEGDDLEAETIADACIRCDKGGEDGTMGFFVAGFVKDLDPNITGDGHELNGHNVIHDNATASYQEAASEDEWSGFED